MPVASSKSIRVVFGTLLTFAIVCAVGRSLTAEVVGPGRFLFGPPVTASAADEARVTVSNICPAPARVRVFFVKASDFSPLAAGPQTTIAARSSAVVDQSLNVFIPSDFPVLVVVRHRSNAATNLKVSLQVTDPLGKTLIFTDSFLGGTPLR